MQVQYSSGCCKEFYEMEHNQRRSRKLDHQMGWLAYSLTWVQKHAAMEKDQSLCWDEWNHQEKQASYES